MLQSYHLFLAQLTTCTLQEAVVRLESARVVEPRVAFSVNPSHGDIASISD